MTKIELKTGPWLLSDLDNIPKNGYKVFSCFHCGGGSTMGYKLAGFDVIGGVEIDKEMMRVYRANHHPKFSYLMGVQEFKNIPNDQLPNELFNLDVLDGSPPCSSFSMAGSREKKWGKSSHFREGQTEQVLDDLFFHYIDIAKKLQPKVVVAENVKGLIQGNAKGYVKEIFAAFKDAGYLCQLFLLNAAAMGVPQYRERTFFIANKINKKIKLEFNEKQISVIESIIGCSSSGQKQLTSEQNKWWSLCKIGDAFSTVHPKGSWFNSIKLDPNRPANTLAASAHRSASGLYHWSEKRQLNPWEYARIQTFPEDFKAIDLNNLVYLCGMSVPPFMMQRIANQIAIQLLDKNNGH